MLTIKDFIENLYSQFPILKKITQKLHQEQAIILLVGGAVRDYFLGHESKDFDIEVYNISAQDLESALSQFGPVSNVGKIFGVFKLHGLPFDFSLPRLDEPGRKPKVTLDQHLEFKTAFSRRDLTINAMGINLVTGELVDPFNGKGDLEKKILRAPDPKFFIEDPLRFYRVMQFIGRLEMYPDTTLNQLCRMMDISKVSRERISDEFEKLLLKSKSPSLGFRWLLEIGRLEEIVPEIAILKKIEQKPIWHPEGDVFEHSMQTVDGAATLQKKYKTREEKLIFLFAALLHDIGKKGGINEHGHDERGAELVPQTLSKMTINKNYIVPVQKLVRYHMMPGQFSKQNAGIPAYKRLARKLAPETDLEMLIDVSIADKCGRNPHSHIPILKEIAEIEQFKKIVMQQGILKGPEKPLLEGRDLLEYFAPGKKLGEILHKAYEMQIEEGIKNKEELKEKIIKMFKKD